MSSEHLAQDETVNVQTRFTTWVESQGVRLAGIRSRKTANSGTGIVAEREINAGDVVAEVPATALLSMHLVPTEVRRRCGNVSAHGLLACFLALDDPSVHKYTVWKDTWPSKSEMDAVMPLAWSEACTSLLPVGASVMLDRQRSKFLEDWRSIEKAFPGVNQSQYMYFWLIINTRSFYFEVDTSDLAAQADNMVLCPFLDFFNHQDHGCSVSFNEHGYNVTAQKSYSIGEEVYTCYGAHSCDALLIDYGFVLQSNQWDNVQLDHLLDRVLKSEKERNMLEQVEYLGDYFLNADGVCHRTQVAVRTLTLSTERWRSFVAGELAETSNEQALAEQEIARVLLRLHNEAIEMMNHLQTRHRILPPLPHQLILDRWTQIDRLVTRAIDEDFDQKVRRQFRQQFGI